MRNRDEILRQIDQIREQLDELRLALVEEEQETQPAGVREEESLRVGDWVRINNPNFGQESTGKVHKINPKTNFITIIGKRFGRKILRKEKNLTRLE